MRMTLALLVLAGVLEIGFSVRVTLEGGNTGMYNIEPQLHENRTLSCSASPTTTGGDMVLEWTYTYQEGGEMTHLYLGGKVVDTQANKIAFVNPLSIIVKNLMQSDSGFYQCRVVIANDRPTVDTGTYNLTVLVPPNDQISCGFPGDLQITLGQRAEFQCRETVPVAVPAPTYSWFKNGIALPLQATGALYANSSFSYSQVTGTLVFSSVTAGDAGTYYCSVSNKVGSSQCTAAAIRTKEQNVGAIVGIVFGVIFALLLIGVLIWWTWRKGYFDGFCEGKDVEEDAPDDGANDIMLDGAGPLVTKAPSEWSNGTSNKNSIRSTDRRMPEGAVRVMP